MFTHDFLEFLNLNISIMDFFLVGLLLFYIFKAQSWWSGPGFQLAVALLLNYFGHGLIRGWTWFWRFSTEHHLTLADLTDRLPILHLGLALIAISVFLVGQQISNIINVWVWLLIVVLSSGVSAFFAWGI